MRRTLLFTMPLLVIACAKQAATSPVDPSVRTVTVVGAGSATTLRVRQDDGTSEAVVAAAPERVWSVLQSVYDSLGIPVTHSDPRGRLMGTDAFKLRKSLKGTPISRYFDCGTTQIGPNADSYEVLLLAMTRVTPTQGGVSKVEVTLDARARPIAFRQNYTACVSLSTLDTRIVDIIRAKLAAAP